MFFPLLLSEVFDEVFAFSEGICVLNWVGLDAFFLDAATLDGHFVLNARDLVLSLKVLFGVPKPHFDFHFRVFSVNEHAIAQDVEAQLVFFVLMCEYLQVFSGDHHAEVLLVFL